MRVIALLPWFGGGPALLVAQQAGLPAATIATATATATAQILYCDRLAPALDDLLALATGLFQRVAVQQADSAVAVIDGAARAQAHGRRRDLG